MSVPGSISPAPTRNCAESATGHSMAWLSTVISLSTCPLGALNDRGNGRASLMNAAWLRGTIAYLDWVLGDSQVSPLSRKSIPLDPVAALTYQELAQQDWVAMRGVGIGIANIEEEMTVYLEAVILQGREGQPPAEPKRYPPPQWGEGVQQAHDWAVGEDSRPPADHHGCGDYHPCPGQIRCVCEAAGHCRGGQCPACVDSICNAAWSTIEATY